MSGSADRDEAARAPTRRRLFALAPAALLVAISAWEIASISCVASEVASTRDWERAAAVVRVGYAPGDLIVFAPAWVDPVGRLHLGDLISIDDAARMDAAGYRTVWEVSARGARAPETRERTLMDSIEVGALVVRRWQAEPAVAVTSFVGALAAAEVSGQWVGKVEVRLEEVGFEPHRCVRAIPRAGETVTVRYPGVELGRELVGYVGLADVFTRRDIRAPARLELRIDGESVAALELGVDDGWVRFSAATEPRPAADVEFAITAVGPRARDRRVCFAAEARR